MDKLIKNEMINSSYKGLGVMRCLYVFLHLSGSPKWLFTVSEVEQGLNMISSTISLSRGNTCACSISLLMFILSTGEALFPKPALSSTQLSST